MHLLISQHHEQHLLFDSLFFFFFLNLLSRIFKFLLEYHRVSHLAFNYPDP
uniref:Uncharacterized protein n=1 Tax=Rhizophora mucronata TaxID=61149 RepID=A0A2P2N9K8_RHIMU